MDFVFYIVVASVICVIVEAQEDTQPCFHQKLSSTSKGSQRSWLEGATERECIYYCWRMRHCAGVEYNILSRQCSWFSKQGFQENSQSAYGTNQYFRCSKQEINIRTNLVCHEGQHCGSLFYQSKLVREVPIFASLTECKKACDPCVAMQHDTELGLCYIFPWTRCPKEKLVNKPSITYCQMKAPKDADYCDESHCIGDAECINNPTNRTCTCAEHFYYAEGAGCKSVDYCGRKPCIGETSQCTSFIGGRTCNCSDLHQEYEEDVGCVQVDYCKKEPCLGVNPTCTAGLEGRNCTCDEHFEYDDNDGCIARNYCEINPCKGNAVQCERNIGSRSCNCMRHYKYDDQIGCIEIDYCNTTQCKVGANCSSHFGGRTCHCEKDFEYDDRKGCKSTLPCFHRNNAKLTDGGTLSWLEGATERECIYFCWRMRHCAGVEYNIFRRQCSWFYSQGFEKNSHYTHGVTQYVRCREEETDTDGAEEVVTDTDGAEE